MKLINPILLFFPLVLIVSCMSENHSLIEPLATDPISQYEYNVGLGYGFLGKAVHVTINGREVLSIVGTEEIEQFAQLQGTMMLESGSSPEKDIMILVTIDNNLSYEQAIDLSTGGFIHIYHEKNGLRIFNTRFNVLE
jgi:hypothetical protein